MPSREQIAAALKYMGDKANLRQRFERATSLDPQEQDMADIAVETAASFVPGVGQALAARDVERARRANDPAGMAMASMGAIPGGRLAKLLKRYDPVMQQLDVYHGTPHKFPATEANPLGEFDASKIGTGEGAQVYGRGIYFTESPQAATQYKERLSSSKPSQASFIRMRDQEQVGSEVWNYYNELARQRESSLYKADLPDEMIDRMLDYDKPINEHNQFVLDALEKAGINTQSEMRAGQMIQGQEAHLAKFGIPGLTYREQGGPRNFVVFPGEEKKVRILERDGKKVADMLQRATPTSAQVEVDIYPLRSDPNTLYLSKIAVPKDQQGRGLGSQAMQEIINKADAEGKRVVLSPSTEYGASSVGRLKDFYKRFGFVENKGRNKNYAISESMYRDPKKSK